MNKLLTFLLILIGITQCDANPQLLSPCVTANAPHIKQKDLQRVPSHVQACYQPKPNDTYLQPTTFTTDGFCGSIGLGTINFTFGKLASAQDVRFQLKGHENTVAAIPVNTPTTFLKPFRNGVKSSYSVGVTPGRVYRGLYTNTKCGGTNCLNQQSGYLLAGNALFGEFANNTNKTEFYSICNPGGGTLYSNNITIWTAPDGQDSPGYPGHKITIANQVEALKEGVWLQIDVQSIFANNLKDILEKSTVLSKFSDDEGTNWNPSIINNNKINLANAHMQWFENPGQTILLNLTFNGVTGSIQISSIDFLVTYSDGAIWLRLDEDDIPPQALSPIKPPSGYTVSPITPCSK